MGTPEAGEVAGPWYSCQVSRAQGCRGEIADVWGSCGRLHAGGSGVATRTTTVDAEGCVWSIGQAGGKDKAATSRG